MSETALKVLSDAISEAHARIQQAHAELNPVVEVRRGMRDSGIPADVITIDCLSSRRRILLVLHDDSPSSVLYQFSSMDEEMGVDFIRVPLSDLSTDQLFNWIGGYFLEGKRP